MNYTNYYLLVFRCICSSKAKGKSEEKKKRRREKKKKKEQVPFEIISACYCGCFSKQIRQHKNYTAFFFP